MQSKSWQWQGKGEPQTPVLKDVILGELGDNEVLVQNTCIGLNPVDWKLIQGGHPAWRKDHVPGVDGAGVVIKTGKNMERIPLGARVCYHADLTKNGSFSTHTLVSGNSLIYIPQKISDAVAAAFPCPSLTAWQALQKIPVVSNKYVLVNGAGGSVGYMLTQLLIQYGAKVYITASPEHHEEYYRMGVAGAVDYKSNGWKEELKQLLRGRLFDALFDTVSGSVASGLTDLLGYYGHIVSIQDRVKANPQPAFTTCISLHEVALGASHKYATAQQVAQLMEEGENLLSGFATGKWKQRALLTRQFHQLNSFLQEMKEQQSSYKYVVEVS